MPRLAGIEHPFGQTMGKPGDKDVQRAVLLGALDALEEMKMPGCVKHLQFEWTGTAKETKTDPPDPPPIANYLKWHPWELPRLFSRDVPKKS
ncbi:MAG: hypothetical protein HZB61_14235 [Nitrospirae bacterium]|nr:hypothetical protein [Nitrospirota bacterium]